MIHEYFAEMLHNPLIILTAMAVALDTVLGLLRAVRERNLNSSFGIDGAIRKSTMLISVLFLMLADFVVQINLIAFLPEELRDAIGLRKIGIGEFFCVLYVVYEAVSILKNMYLCGIPIPKGIEGRLEKLLTEMTQEIKREVNQEASQEMNQETSQETDQEE